jgi:putative peptidoglycan binding protein
MSSDWRLAKSLVVLRDEIEARYPGTTVWTIGDQEHQRGYSDHNPSECCDVVCAADILGDRGLDLPAFVSYLVVHPHPNMRYVIFNRKIYERSNGFEARDYHGSNPHDHHVHVSVGNGPDGRGTRDYDSTTGWGIADLGKPSNPSKPSKPSSDWTREAIMSMPTLKRGAKGTDTKRLQGLLTANGYGTAIDGAFGPNTERQVKAFQAKHAKPSDGIVGKLTWTALLGA